MDLEGPLVADESVVVEAMLAVLWQPVVELGLPVLDGVDRHDAEDPLGACTAQDDLDERDYLEGLAQAHGVREDAAEAGLLVLDAGERLDYVVVHEADAADLVGLGVFGDVGKQAHVGVFGRVVDCSKKEIVFSTSC